MFCKHCGSMIDDNSTTCPNCKNTVGEPKSKKVIPDNRCLPSFILGLIGSIFGLLGGICTTMCSFGSSSNSAFIFIFGGSLIGLIGACKCLNNCKIGSILETVGAILIIYRAFFNGGSDFMTVIALLFLLSGGLIALFKAFVINRKK